MSEDYKYVPYSKPVTKSSDLTYKNDFIVCEDAIEYIINHPSIPIEAGIDKFKEFKDDNPLVPMGKRDYALHGKMHNWWHCPIPGCSNDMRLVYERRKIGNKYKFALIGVGTHTELGIKGGQSKSKVDSSADRFDNISKSIYGESLNRTSKSTGYKPMKIITESSAPVTIEEAKTKAALYATAWGHSEVSLTLFEKFALVESIEGEKGKFAKIAFAIDNKFQKPNNIEKSVIKCLTSTGEEVDMELMIFNYEDISDVKVRDNIHAFKMNESVIFLEGTLPKAKRVVKSCAAALASSQGKTKMNIHMVESNATLNEYKKVKQVQGKLITIDSIQDGKQINTVSGLIESNVTKIADKNILGCILEGVMSAASVAEAKQINESAVLKGKSLVKRYAKKNAGIVESVEDDAYDKWQEDVLAANPELKGKIKFVNKNDHDGSIIVSAQVGDRSLGVFDIDKNKGELLSEGTNIPAKNLLGSFRGPDGKTYTYGKTANKWAIKNGLEHEIESGSKLEQNKFGNIKGNIAHFANNIDESSGVPILTKMAIRHVWKNEPKQEVQPETPSPIEYEEDMLDEAVTSFVIEYEIKDQEKTTQGKVTYQANDQNDAKQRFLDDHKGEGQVTVKSVTAALAEDLGVTDSAIGVTGGTDSAYVVYADANGRKQRKVKHGTNEEITEAIESEGGKIISIQDGKSAELDESLDPTEMDKLIADALEKAYVTANKAKEQYDRTYTDEDDLPFDFDEAVSDAFEAELQSIIDQFDDTINHASDKVDGFLAGKNESVEQPKTKQHHYAEFMTRFFGK